MMVSIYDYDYYIQNPIIKLKDHVNREREAGWLFPKIQCYDKQVFCTTRILLKNGDSCFILKPQEPGYRPLLAAVLLNA